MRAGQPLAVMSSSLTDSKVLAGFLVLAAGHPTSGHHLAQPVPHVHGRQCVRTVWNFSEQLHCIFCMKGRYVLCWSDLGQA
jgi:hypothetical protein